jgi:hypothetical protein
MNKWTQQEKKIWGWMQTWPRSFYLELQGVAERRVWDRGDTHHEIAREMVALFRATGERRRTAR